MKFSIDHMTLLAEYVRCILRESVFVDLSINGKKIRVEIANTPDTRSLGLMHRTVLEPDGGMLFIFPESGQQSFWMKNTNIPLSIAYIGDAGQILNIEDMVPMNTQRVQSVGPAMFALEMNNGWFDHNGVHSGDQVDGLSNYARRQK